jgi:hypothetical protein
MGSIPFHADYCTCVENGTITMHDVTFIVKFIKFSVNIFFTTSLKCQFSFEHCMSILCSVALDPRRLGTLTLMYDALEIRDHKPFCRSM